MLRHKNNQSRNIYKNYRTVANMQLHLTQLQVRCLFLNIHKNIGMLTRTRTRIRYKQDMKSAFRKTDHAGSYTND